MEPRRVAIVTGASQGIGAGLASAFADAGYAVVATARSIPDRDEESYASLPGDIADPQTASRVVGRAVERFGRIDVLVNNAGMFIGKPFTDYTADDLAAIVSVNLTGFFHFTQRALRQMLEQRSGHVVNVSTSLVEHPHADRPAALAALTKGGLAAAARSLAIEYAPHGIRVNAVSLGVIQTPAHDPASYAGLAAQHPLDRLGSVADVVDGVLYLERATFVTGELLHIDGGQAAGG